MPLHVSSKQVLIIRGINLYQYVIWYNTLWWVTAWRAGQEFHLDRHVRHSPTRLCYTRWRIDTSWSSWWWALVCLKHVEAWKKYIEKECVKLVINQNYVEMHGQQNIKLCLCSLYGCHNKHFCPLLYNIHNFVLIIKRKDMSVCLQLLMNFYV
jgi:hypothetical protein